MLVFMRMVARLPLAWMHLLGAGVGWLAVRVPGSYRDKLVSNLRQAALVGQVRDGGQVGQVGQVGDVGTAGTAGDDAAERRLIDAAARQAGRMVFELPYVWFRPLPLVLSQVVCTDHHVFDEAEGRGRGILFLTPHLGAFEITARYYAQRQPVSVLFKPPKRAMFGPVLQAARNYPGLSAAPANLSGLRTLLRALRRGEAIGLLPDQVPTDGEGRWAPFFGRPAYTMTLPQRLAEQTGAAVVVVLGERLPDSKGWRMHAQLMDELPTPEAVNRVMEELIRRFPDQYLWGYNRYKQPAGVAAP